MTKLPVDFMSVPHGTDVQGMRRWIEEKLLDGALWEHRNNCKIQRRRPEVPVDIQDLQIPCTDGSGDHFGIRVYQPRLETEQLRPAILMFHGGGWIHGDPRGDDCEYTA